MTKVATSKERVKLLIVLVLSDRLFLCINHVNNVLASCLIN